MKNGQRAVLTCSVVHLAITVRGLLFSYYSTHFMMTLLQNLKKCSLYKILNICVNVSPEVVTDLNIFTNWSPYKTNVKKYWSYLRLYVYMRCLLCTFKIDLCVSLVSWVSMWLIMWLPGCEYEIKLHATKCIGLLGNCSFALCESSFSFYFSKLL